MIESAEGLLFVNARLVLSDEVIIGSLEVRDGVMASIRSGEIECPDCRIVDCHGDYLLPGLVELHTDNLERHCMPRPSVAWPDLVAAAVAHDREIIASGITTVFDSIRVGSYRDEGDARSEQLFNMLSALSEGERHAVFKAEHRLHLRCELTDPDLPDMLERACLNNEVSLVSMMDHTPGQRQWADMDALRRHSRDKYPNSDELEEVLQRRIEVGDRYVPPNRTAVLQRFKGTNVVLATHDDTTREHVEEALSQGVAIAEFPCSMEAAKAADACGLKILGGAPNIVRGGSHSGNVSMHDLASAGVLHALSSDYVPASLLQAVFKLVLEEQWSVPAAVALITANTASMAGLTDRGRLAVGLRADLVRLRMAGNTPVVESVHVSGRRVA